MRNFIFILLSVFVFVSCNKKVAMTPEQEDAALTKYIADHALTAYKIADGMYVVFTDSGSSSHPTIASNVKVNYKGYFTDGKVFDQSKAGSPLDIPLANVIEGWQRGIPLFGKGGKGILLIPSKLAYGDSGAGDIPPNTPILFDIELVDFY